MLSTLVNKMTRKMLWTIIIPVAILICMFSILVGVYSWVVFKSDEVSYEGVLGKFSAKINDVQNQLKDALRDNDQLTKNVDQLKKSLSLLEMKCGSTAAFVPQQSKGKSINTISSSITDITKNLTSQSNLLVGQKKKLEAVDEEIIRFKEKLKELSQKLKNSNKSK